MRATRRGGSATTVRALGVRSAPTRADGTPLFVPTRGATLGVALALAAAVVALGRGGLLHLPALDGVFRVASWGLGGVLLVRAVGDRRYVRLFKRERHTDFARVDTR